MTPRIPGPEDEALEVLRNAVTTMKYVLARLALAVEEGDIATAYLEARHLQFYAQRDVIEFLGIKDEVTTNE